MTAASTPPPTAIHLMNGFKSGLRARAHPYRKASVHATASEPSPLSTAAIRSSGNRLFAVSRSTVSSSTVVCGPDSCTIDPTSTNRPASKAIAACRLRTRAS